MQEIIVALIVLAACWAILKRYLPRSLRVRLTQRLAEVCAAHGWQRLEQGLRSASTSGASQGACGSCSSCGSCGEEVGSESKQSGAMTPEALKNTIRR